MYREILKNIPKIKKRSWVALCLVAGVLFLVAIYVVYLYIASFYYHIPLPGYAFAIAIGSLLGACAYVIDSLSHRALRKRIPREEHLVHYFIIFGAVLPLLISLVFAYWFGKAALPFSIIFFILQIFYVCYDEAAFHWKRADVTEQMVHWVIIWATGAAEIALFYWAYVDQYTGLSQLLASIG